MRILLVDDDPGLRILLRTTFEIAEIEVDEAESAAAAQRRIARRKPDVIVLDVHMPGMNGIEFTRQLKSASRTADIPVVLLTGSSGDEDLDAAGADAVMQKPFGPLELLALVERLAGGLYGVPFRVREPQEHSGDALLLYARDLRHLLELERGQREALQAAYVETVGALASALETKDTGTGTHSQRVRRYATVLADAIDGRLSREPGVQYGFLLHDVGKIGIPDSILLKAGPLTRAQRRQMQTHTVLGEQMLGGVGALRGNGLEIVRSHHERWDGNGYPDGLSGEEIPLAARVFAVADALDAMTSNRPYRRAVAWSAARDEILRESAKQFDPDVVDAFGDTQDELRTVRREFARAAA